MCRASCLLAALAALLLLPSTTACGAQYFHRGRLLSEAAPAGAASNWSYAAGGADWGGTCASGRRQSPIGINLEGISHELPPEAHAQLDFGLARGLRIFHTGHFLQVEWDSLEGANASVPILGDEWASVFDPAQVTAAGSDDTQLRQVPVTPTQIHWHSACEHLVDGESCPLELHIVTAVDNSTGVPVPNRCNQAPCLAVFGVVLKHNVNVHGAGAPWYDLLTRSAPKIVGASAATHLPHAWLDLSSLLPQNDQTYATYSGSLTTPPCSEDVMWHVFLEQKRELSASQVDAYQSIVSGAHWEAVEGSCPTGGRTSNRFVQPLGERTVFVSPGF